MTRKFWKWFAPGEPPVLAASLLVILIVLSTTALSCWAINGLAL